MQLIFNKTSGGGNKVKINGLPPAERLNLKEAECLIERDNLIPFELGTKIIKHKDEHYVYNRCSDFSSSTKRLMKFKIGEPWTEISRQEPDIFFNFIENDVFYSEYGDGQGIHFYKIENGKMTILSTLNFTDYRETGAYLFNLGKDYYFVSLNKKFYKSTDFGVTWTNITNQVTILDNLNDVNLFNLPERIVFNNILYIFDVYNNKRILSFDGKTFKIHKTDVSVRFNRAYIEGVHCDEAPFFYIPKGNAEEGYYPSILYEVYKIFNTENGMDFKLHKEFTAGSFGSNLLVKDDKYFLFGKANTTKNFYEYVKTYIPE